MVMENIEYEGVQEQLSKDDTLLQCIIESIQTREIWEFDDQVMIMWNISNGIKKE